MTRGLNKFGCNDDVRKRTRVSARFSWAQMAKRTQQPHGKPARRVLTVAD